MTRGIKLVYWMCVAVGGFKYTSERTYLFAFYYLQLNWDFNERIKTNAK